MSLKSRNTSLSLRGGGGSGGKISVGTTDGVDQYVETNQRFIDVDNLEGLSIEGYFDGGQGTYFSQSVNSSLPLREFQIFENGGTISLVAGGTGTSISSGNLGFGSYKFEFQAGNVIFSFNSEIISTVSYSVGAEREPSATFKILARGSGAGSVGFLKPGTVYNFKVNDGSVYNIPFDDSFANNPTTGTGADIAYINATEASWSFE